MPDTYDPNELVKLKHLDEFARQLRIKMDGGTDPKLDTPLIEVRAGVVNAITPGQEIYGNTPYDNTPLVFQLTTAQATSTYVSFRLRGYMFNSIPTTLQWQGAAKVMQTSWRADSMPVSVTNRSCADISVACPTQTVTTISGTIIVPESATYKKVEIPVILNVVEP